MNYTSMNVHQVERIEVREVENHVNGTRWQEVHFLMKDGSRHTVTAFLLDGYPGFQAFQRPEEPQRRAEDLPRQQGMAIDMDPDGHND